MEAKVSVESSVAQTGTAGLAVSRQIAMIRAKAGQNKMTQITAEGASKAQQANVLIVTNYIIIADMFRGKENSIKQLNTHLHNLHTSLHIMRKVELRRTTRLVHE